MPMQRPDSRRGFMSDPRLRGNFQRMLGRRVPNAQGTNQPGMDSNRAGQMSNAIQGLRNQRVPQWAQGRGRMMQNFMRNRPNEQPAGGLSPSAPVTGGPGPVPAPSRDGTTMPAPDMGTESSIRYDPRQDQLKAQENQRIREMQGQLAGRHAAGSTLDNPGYGIKRDDLAKPYQPQPDKLSYYGRPTTWNMEPSYDPNMPGAGGRPMTSTNVPRPQRIDGYLGGEDFNYRPSQPPMKAQLQPLQTGGPPQAGIPQQPRQPQVQPTQADFASQMRNFIQSNNQRRR